MNPGILNRIITIQTSVDTETNGHSEMSWSVAETVRANVTQIDGSRFVNDEELKDRVIYKIICWDNGYDNNIRIGLDNLILFPVKPITANPGSSNLSEIVIYACTKTSSILTT
jgi:head-tail adaptor